jgi:predicted aminopeptidase
MTDGPRDKPNPSSGTGLCQGILRQSWTRFVQRRKRLVLLPLALACLALGGGCQTAGYYRQAVRGQWQIRVCGEPLDSLLARADLPEARREKFERVLQLREFAARELQLPANGHYTRFVELHRPHVVWIVSATPEFSTEAKTWWYPLVGSLTYRGYFTEAAARHYGAQLMAAGWDVCVEPVDAYSTLGWFRDPVLSSFIDYPEPELAGIIFHELAHQKLFKSGDTEFNEAFAIAVEQDGVRRWLRTRRTPAMLAQYEADLERDRQFVALVLEARGRLEQLFRPHLSGDGSSPGAASSEGDIELRQRKQAVFDEMRAAYARLKELWGGDSRYDRWFARPLNNAHLNTVETYHGLQSGFERLLREHHDHLPAFYDAARRLSKRPKEERHRLLKESR